MFNRPASISFVHTLCRNLDDGTHIIHPSRYARLELDTSPRETNFIPAHQNFRVIAIAAPVPPYPGHPLDPPFRSRFQARYVDPVGASLSLESSIPSQKSDKENHQLSILREIILSVQYASEARHSLETVSRTSLPPFPQTALLKLRKLTDTFPFPSKDLPSEQLSRLMLVLNPALLSAPFRGWAALSRQTEDAGLGPLNSPSEAGIADGNGLLSYRVIRIDRVDDITARVLFESTVDQRRVAVLTPAGPKPFVSFPLSPDWTGSADSVLLTNRFHSSLVCLLQAHSLGWDISMVPPVQPATATCSTSLLVKALSDLLGYETEDVYLYKELGGRELIMRREIEENGATSWMPRLVFQCNSCTKPHSTLNCF